MTSFRFLQGLSVTIHNKTRPYFLMGVGITCQACVPVRKGEEQRPSTALNTEKSEKQGVANPGHKAARFARFPYNFEFSSSLDPIDQIGPEIFDCSMHIP